MDNDDDALASAARDGDARAFGELVARHEGAVRRFLRRAAGHAADDLAQEAFLKAWRQRRDWRGDGSYRGWLMRLAWTAFLDANRTAQRSAARDAAWADAAPPSPDAELTLAVAQALAELSPSERAAAELCFAQGFSHSDAAAILRMPLGTLKSAVARARARLAILLEPSP